MKRPAFQFYPSDWRKDAALQSCSPAARGLWIEMICLMHECEPYGHLAINGSALSDAQAARMVGFSLREYRSCLRELEVAGVLSTNAAGVIFSRRMVRDESLRNTRAAGGAAGAEHGIKGKEHGAKGGRPRLVTGVNKPPLLPPKEPPPSSSASASEVLPTGVSNPQGCSAVDNSAQTSKPDGDKSPEKQGKPEATERLQTVTGQVDWWRSNDGIEAKGRELGVNAKPGELHGEYKRRLFDVIGETDRRAIA